jgi:hypothetical protein
MTFLSPIRFKFSDVVIGWREEAVEFARANCYHLIVNSEQRPFHYLVGHQDVKSKWLDSIYDLGMNARLPVPFEVRTIAFEDGDLKIITEGNTKVLIDFKTLHIFDTDNFETLEVEEIIKDHLVYDLFDVTQGSRLGEDFTLLCNEELLQSIKFVPSNRIDQNHHGEFKDIIVRSCISDCDLRSFDFSETIVRIKLERKLKEHNIQTENGLPLKVRHAERQAIKRDFYFEIVGELDPRIVLYG